MRQLGSVAENGEADAQERDSKESMPFDGQISLDVDAVPPSLFALFAVPSQPSERAPTARFHSDTEHGGSVSCHSSVPEEEEYSKENQTNRVQIGSVTPLTREALEDLSAASGDSGGKLLFGKLLITTQKLELRVRCTLGSSVAGKLPAGSCVRVLSLDQLADGTPCIRLAAAEDGMTVLGWASCFDGDGGENLGIVDDFTDSPPLCDMDKPAGGLNAPGKTDEPAEVSEAQKAVEASREELAEKERLAAAIAAREASAGAMLNEARVTLFAARFQRKNARRAAKERALEVAERFIKQQKHAAREKQAQREQDAATAATAATMPSIAGSDESSIADRTVHASAVDGADVEQGGAAGAADAAASGTPWP